MKAVFKLEMLKNIQDKGLIFWIFILPIIFTILFISIFTSGVDTNLKNEMIISIVPGYTVMFVFFIMISMGNSFIDDRDKGMVARLTSTSLTPLQYVAGKWGAFMVIVAIQIIVLQTFGKLVYTIPMEQPFSMVIIALALTFCTTGLGLALSILIRTNNMGIAITQVVALVGAMIGGLWMPLETMPDFFQTISRFTPQYWAHIGFKDAMAGTISLPNLLLSTIILIGFGIGGLLIAMLAYPKFLQRAKN